MSAATPASTHETHGTVLGAAPEHVEGLLNVAVDNLAAVRRAFGVAMDTEVVPIRSALWTITADGALQWFGSFREGVMRMNEARPAPTWKVGPLVGFVVPSPSGRGRIMIFHEGMQRP